MQGEPPLGSRARRAIPLIAAALTVAVVAGLLYLRPHVSAPMTPASQTPSAPTLESAFSATYEFITPGLGWALVGGYHAGTEDYWVFRTSDGARHWTLQWSGSPEGQGRVGVQLTFFDRAHGFFSLADHFVYRTEDGGAHWTREALPPDSFLQLDYADWTHAWYLGAETAANATLHFFLTSDGGQSWSELAAPPGGEGFAFRSASEGWVGSSAQPDLVYSTSDGGSTWQAHQLPVSRFDAKTFGPLSEVRLLPAGGVLALVGFDLAFTSFDGGQSWRQVAPLPVTGDYTSVVFQDAHHWWVMRAGNLFKSSDAGQTWQHTSLQLDDWEYTIGVIDSRHAWARLDYGFRPSPVAGTGLALTSDGGVHWTYVSVPSPA